MGFLCPQSKISKPSGKVHAGKLGLFPPLEGVPRFLEKISHEAA